MKLSYFISCKRNAYVNQGKKVVAVGVAFDAETRTISEWKDVVT